MIYLTCPKCGSTDIRKNGKYDKGDHIGEQAVKCKKCKYKSFVTNFGGLNLPIAPIGEEQKQIEYARYSKHRIGTTASDITRKRMSESHMGKPSYWKGKTFSKETCDKMSSSRMGRVTWNKGLETPPETIEKMKISMKGIPKPPRSKEHCKKISKRMSATTHGANNIRWNGGITPFLKTIRMLPEMYEWRSKVMERDDYRDCFTGIRGNGDLEVHHIVPFSKLLKEYDIKTVEDALSCKELWDTNNGVTMFKDTHMDHHKKYKNSILPKEYYSKKDSS